MAQDLFKVFVNLNCYFYFVLDLIFIDVYIHNRIYGHFGTYHLRWQTNASRSRD